MNNIFKSIFGLASLSFMPLAFANGITAAQEQQCGCDYTMSTYQGSFNGVTAGIQPGDTICLDATVNYSKMQWSDVIGTEQDPVTIKNCGGQAYINSIHLGGSGYGWRFYNSSFIKIKGDGDPQHQYGIKVSTTEGFYISMERRSTNIEIANVEIAGLHTVTPTSDHNAFAGIGIKTKPTCDGLSNQDTWTMYDISVHDNYIHDVGGEGLYIGHGFYEGRPDTDCPLVNGEAPILKSHSIKGLRVFNNLVENTGYDGIQVKNADEDARIHHNVIRNYGLKENGNHDEGLFIGDGSEAYIYNNWVDNGPGVKKGHGIKLNGFGNSRVYNNVVVNYGADAFPSGQVVYTGKRNSSIYLNNNPYYNNNYEGTFKIYNNTFVGAQHYAIEAYTSQAIELKNNIFTGYDRQSSISSTAVTDLSNIFNPDITALNFVDAANQDFRLLATSTAVNNGVNTRAVVNDDYDGLLRRDGNTDIGAYELNGIDPNTAPSIFVVTPSNDITLTHDDIWDDVRERFLAVFIEAELIDPAGVAVNVQYILNGRHIGTDRLPRATEHWIGGQRLNVGANDFYAIAVDINGTVTRSPSITITLLADD